jgi:hypothetical protein
MYHLSVQASKCHLLPVFLETVIKPDKEVTSKIQTFPLPPRVHPVPLAPARASQARCS